ncbi:hypothetical protein P154DRAFT_573316 [Amniculicola lignicola CBS 123094]|uniref:Uncharacterized protein n=1 Tax=Amniculicola lignicola CBS 123094 TaxID=1392246 RepID=A0A6A5WQX9_9PLEO|nr:hypothetical protein P154DRAFT_573316 [Amniculicola lignicola CBS 123094]
MPPSGAFSTSAESDDEKIFLRALDSTRRLLQNLRAIYVVVYSTNPVGDEEALIAAFENQKNELRSACEWQILHIKEKLERKLEDNVKRLKGKPPSRDEKRTLVKRLGQLISGHAAEMSKIRNEAGEWERKKQGLKESLMWYERVGMGMNIEVEEVKRQLKFAKKKCGQCDTQVEENHMIITDLREKVQMLDGKVAMLEEENMGMRIRLQTMT